jgi:hypothetical protein
VLAEDRRKGSDNLPWTASGLSAYDGPGGHGRKRGACADSGLLSGLLGICSARHLAILWQIRHDPTMTQSFTSFTRAAAVLALAAALVPAALSNGQESGARLVSSADAERTARPDSASLIARAAERVASEPAIAADLRARVEAYGHVLIGSGRYLQLATPLGDLLKLQLRLQLGQQSASLVQVRGEDFFWNRRDVPPAPPTLERVNLRTLRKAAASAARPGAPDADLLQGNLALGGLPQLLAALSRDFSYDAPRADELAFTASDGRSIRRLPIWRLSGRWKADRLAALKRSDGGKPAAAPEQLPERVELVLGRTEEILPLFPYRIAYWAAGEPEANDRSGQPPAPRQCLLLELFNVSRQPIDPQEFVYNPGDQEIRDVTARYVQRISGAPQ